MGNDKRQMINSFPALTVGEDGGCGGSEWIYDMYAILEAGQEMSCIFLHI